MLYIRSGRRKSCYIGLSILLLPLLAFHGIAQPKIADTISMSLPDAEKMFLEKNLALIAQQYNVDISKALVQQAKYWDNPVLNTDQNIYDGKFFRHNNNYGQIFIQIQQVIKTAGKRNKAIRLASDQVLTSTQQFNDLLRNLKYLLRNDFSSLNQMLRTNKIYTTEINSVTQLVAGMDAQLAAGNISQKDNLRLKALLYSLQSDQTDLLRQMAEQQTELHTLLQLPAGSFINPILPDNIDTKGIDQLNLTELIDSAKLNRPDANLAQTNLLLQQHNLSYQKSLAVPDLTVGVEYDQRSSYINNYYGLALSFPIPILNRNKGNIAAAQFSIKQAQTGVLQIQNQVESEVAAAYQKLLTIYRLQQQSDRDLQGKYDQLLRNMLESYRQRQVSLLEFLDFFGAYKDAQVKQLQQETNFRQAMEEINLTTGKDIIQPR
ncbi:MAG: TolC family protein [Bacteroidetes bacterium]|nr:TolC family protein [Bacteroidota bacterium]